MPPLKPSIQSSSIASKFFRGRSPPATKLSFNGADHESKKKVRFTSVSIREYVRIVGDHPDCVVGPPMAIGWEYVEVPAQGIDTFEADHLVRRSSTRLSSTERKELLSHEFGVPEIEIRLAEKRAHKSARRRLHSAKQTKAAELAETFWQSAIRKLKRTITLDYH